jgi:hypothetical protein
MLLYNFDQFSIFDIIVVIIIIIIIIIIGSLCDLENAYKLLYDTYIIDIFFPNII